MVGINIPFVNAQTGTDLAGVLFGSSGRVKAATAAEIVAAAGLAAIATSGSATDLIAGTVNDLRLSSNVPLKNAASNIFTGAMTVGGLLRPTGDVELTSGSFIQRPDSNILLGWDVGGDYVAAGSNAGVARVLNIGANHTQMIFRTSGTVRGGFLSNGNFQVGNNADNGSLLQVFGTANISGAATLGSTLNVTGASTLTGGATISTGLTVNAFVNAGFNQVTGGVITAKGTTYTGYYEWVKNDVRHAVMGYDNGSDLSLTVNAGGAFSVVATGIKVGFSGPFLKNSSGTLQVRNSADSAFATAEMDQGRVHTRLRVGTLPASSYPLEVNGYGQAYESTAIATGWLSRNSLSQWGAQVSTGGDWEVMQYIPSVFRRLWVTQAGEVYTQNQQTTASATTGNSLTIRAIASQTGRLLRFANVSNAEIGFVGVDGSASFNGTLSVGGATTFSSTIQIGATSGPVLRNNAGWLDVRNSTNSGYQRGRFGELQVTAATGGSLATPANVRVALMSQDAAYLAGAITGRTYSNNSAFGDVILSANSLINTGVTDYSNLTDDLAIRGQTGNVEINRGNLILASDKSINMSTGANTFSTFMGGVGNYEGWQHFQTNSVTRLFLTTNGIAVQNNVRLLRNVGNVAEISDNSNLSTRLRISGSTGQQLDLAGSDTVRLITNEVVRLTINSAGLVTSSEFEAQANIRINTSNDLMFNRAGQTSAATGRVRWWTTGQFGNSIGPDGTEFTIVNQSATALRIGSTGNLTVLGRVGINGFTPSTYTDVALQVSGSTVMQGNNTPAGSSVLTIYSNGHGTNVGGLLISASATGNVGAGIINNNANGGTVLDMYGGATSGDVSIRYRNIGDSIVWAAGLDRTDDSFRISKDALLGTNDRLVIAPTGQVTVSQGLLQIGTSTGPILRNNASTLDVRNSSNTGWERLNVLEVRGEGLSYSRFAQMATAGSWGGGYNFNLNGGVANRDSTGTVAAVWYTTTGVNWYAEASGAAGAINPRMTLAPAGLTVTGKVDSGNGTTFGGSGNDNALRANNTYIVSADGGNHARFTMTNAASACTFRVGWTTSHGGVSIESVPVASGQTGYIAWYKPAGTRQGYLGYDVGNDISLVLEQAGGNFKVMNGNINIQSAILLKRSVDELQIRDNTDAAWRDIQARVARFNSAGGQTLVINGTDIAGGGSYMYLTSGSTHLYLRTGAATHQPLTLVNSTCQFAPNVWHGDSVNLERILFSGNGSNFYKGWGVLPHRWRNSSDTEIMSLTDTGNLLAIGTVQVGGASGPLLKNSSGTLQARNSADSAFNAMAVGDLTVNGNVTVTGDLRAASVPPATSTSAGVAGTITWDSGYIYVCVATNTWERAALSTW